MKKIITFSEKISSISPFIIINFLLINTFNWFLNQYLVLKILLYYLGQFSQWIFLTRNNNFKN